MKKIFILFLVGFFLWGCNLDVSLEDEQMSFDIPESFIKVDNSWDITVNGNKTQLSGEKLQVWDVLNDVLLDQKADYFDQVGTGSINDFTWYRLIETVPSLDTPVCTMQTKQLEFAAKEFPEISFIIISNDTPFALQRFCSANGIDNLKVMSDARTREFWKQNSLYLEEYGLLTRSIMIIDEENTIKYIEYANEVTSELGLMNALAYLQSIEK